MRIELRPTIPSDLAHVTHETLPIRIRAITALAGDRVLGIGGIGYRPDGVVIGFAAINEEFRKFPHALHRAGLAMMKIIRESGVASVITLADARFEAAERWLARLGFSPVIERGQPVLADGHKVYVWNARVSTDG